VKIFKKKLIQEAATTKFRQEILEKVWHLMALLDAINDHSFLKNKLVLKGGTALNLFIFDVPRLSVDIDLNYIGAIEREAMMVERPLIEQALETVFKREGFTINRIPGKHAGGKWRLKYESALGGLGNLEVDLNFMFRVPLCEIQKMRSHIIGGYQTQEISLLHLHELGAGKLSALFHRQASRDLFDAYELLTRQKIENEEFRIISLVYGVIGSRDWREISVDDIQFDKRELQNQLIPVMRKNAVEEEESWISWTNRLLQGCKNALNFLLPFSANETDFLNQLYNHSKLDPTLLTSDQQMIEKIHSHPLLQWKIQLISKNNQLR